MDLGKFQGLFDAFVAFLTKLLANVGVDLSKFGAYKTDLEDIAGAAQDALKKED